MSSIGHSEEKEACLVGQAIWATLPDQNSEFVEAFIEGMRQFSRPISDEELRAHFTREFEAEDDLIIKNELIAADEFFEKLAKDTDFQSAVPKKVYYRVLNKGTGKEIQGTRWDIVASYRFESQDREFFLKSKLKEPLPLTALMLGLTKGMIGMKEGGKREICIHPEYGYTGISPIESSTTFIVQVKLKSITPSAAEEYPTEPNKFILSRISKEQLEKEYKSHHLKFAHAYGQSAWGHYRWGEPAYTLEEVISHIYKASQGETIDLSSPEMQKKLVDLHWSLYQKEDNSTSQQSENTHPQAA
ncbi:MAG: hypothetical protein K940chlam2_01525 [Chlamydiae bacterium]|nr:hypothetical protein [Chlamydiota bacterium]